MQPYFVCESKPDESRKSSKFIKNYDEAEFIFFKMLVLSELINMPHSLSELLMAKEPTEMYRRAQKEKYLLFYKFQEWIRNDLKKTLETEQRIIS